MTCVLLNKNKFEMCTIHKIVWTLTIKSYKYNICHLDNLQTRSSNSEWNAFIGFELFFIFRILNETSSLVINCTDPVDLLIDTYIMHPMLTNKRKKNRI